MIFIFCQYVASVMYIRKSLCALCAHWNPSSFFYRHQCHHFAMCLLMFVCIFHRLGWYYYTLFFCSMIYLVFWHLDLVVNRKKDYLKSVILELGLFCFKRNLITCLQIGEGNSLKHIINTKQTVHCCCNVFICDHCLCQIICSC